MVFEFLSNLIFKGLTCKKCGKKRAYKLVKESVNENLDMTGYHRIWETKWRCKYCGHEEVEEKEGHENDVPNDY